MPYHQSNTVYHTKLVGREGIVSNELFPYAAPKFDPTRGGVPGRPVADVIWEVCTKDRTRETWDAIDDGDQYMIEWAFYHPLRKRGGLNPRKPIDSADPYTG